MRSRQILDVVGKDGVQITNAVRAGERKIAAIIFVEQRYRFVREPVFTLPIAEIVGQGATEPLAHFRSGLLMQGGERCLDYSGGFRGLHMYAAAVNRLSTV